MNDPKHTVGKRYGRLVITAVVPVAGKKSRRECLCDCGAMRTYATSNLARGKSTSCGCLQRELASKRSFRHGQCAEFQSWRGMRARCLDKNHQSFEHYGGRGIAICPQWADFECFLADMGRKPSPAHSIDRIDVNGDYEPSNCRWATSEQQSKNRRNSLKVTFNGAELPLKEAAELAGINYSTVRLRIKKHGWSSSRAINQPVCRKAKKEAGETVG